jgi:hypothetical protein
MKGTLKLKERVESAKFGVVFPANVELDCFVDDELRIFAYHPTMKNVCIRIGEMNQYEFKEVEFVKPENA